jgi:uncharacterized protein YjdB
MLIVIILSTFSLSVNASSNTTVSLNKTSATIYVDNSITLKLAGTNKSAVWSTTNSGVATVNSKGKVTAKKAGTATITAKVNGKSYRCKIKVKNVVLSTNKITLKFGKSTTLKLQGGTIKSVKSSKPSVATINKSGKVTAKKTGSTTLTVTSTKNKKYTCKVTVVAYLSNTSLKLASGDIKTIRLQGGTIKSVKSSKPSVATINKSGKVTAKKTGSTTLTVTSTKNKKYTCKVTVVASLHDTSLEIYNLLCSNYWWNNIQDINVYKFNADGTWYTPNFTATYTGKIPLVITGGQSSWGDSGTYTVSNNTVTLTGRNGWNATLTYSSQKEIAKKASDKQEWEMVSDILSEYSYTDNIFYELKFERDEYGLENAVWLIPYGKN